MAGFGILDWLFGRRNSARSIQSQNVRPFTRILSQPVAPENDTILSDGYAPPYRADDLDDFGCETDAMRQAYLRLFREEPALKSAVEGKAESIASLDVMVKPCDDTKPNDVQAAKFVEWAIKATPHGFDGLFLNVLKPAFLLGWSCQEIVLRHVEPDESAEWGGMIGLRHCRSLNTAKLRLQLDAYRNVLGVVNTVRGLGTYARRKVLLYTHNELFHNPFGSGDAATAYRDANVIDAAMRLWGFAIKVYGGPFLKGKYSAKDRRKQMEAALDAARQGGWITMPKEDEVEVINLATATSFDAFQKKIEKHEQRVYTAVRGAYLPYMQGASQGGETRGSAETAKSAGSDPKEFLIGVSACRAINRDVVPHLVTPNFPAGTGMPEVVLGGVNWQETKVQLDVAKSLKDLGHEVEEKYLSKVTGMPIKPKAVQGPGATLAGGGASDQPPGAGSGGAGGTPVSLPPGPPTGDGAGTPAAPALASNPASSSSGPPQRPAAPPAPTQLREPRPAPGATSDATTAIDSMVPAELLAAMTRAAEASDWPAVQRLVNLGRHPEELTALLGGDTGSDNATFAEWSPHTLSDGTSGWMSSGGAVRREKPKGADDQTDDTPAGGSSTGNDSPSAPKRDVIAEAKAAKARREPGRQAAREAWATAVGDPSKVKADQLPVLADHLRTLTRDELRDIGRSLDRSPSGLKEEIVQRLLTHVGAVPAALAPSTRPDGTPVAPTRHDVYTVRPDSLQVDPDRFQYKVSGIKAGGVGDELKGTSTWNPELGGTLLAWRDPSNGQDFVVNGHHRHELANRTGADKVNVRYIDAPTAKEARARGALANIAEGRGTATDAAKYLRDSGQDVDHLRRAGISLSGKVAADAVSLKDLSDGAFQRLTAGDLDETKATAVAKHLKDPKLQDALFKKLDRREEDGKDWSTREVETAAKKMARAGSVTERGTDLFGSFEDEKSTFDQEVELESHISRVLQQTANDYAAVANSGRADRVRGAGNVLAVDENQRRRQAAIEAVADFERESGLKSPVSNAIQQAAVELAGAKTKRERDVVKQRAVETIRGIIAGDGLGVGAGGKPPPADAGGGGAGGGGAPSGDRSGIAGQPDGAADGPNEGDRNADGLILRDGRWRREGEDDSTGTEGPVSSSVESRDLAGAAGVEAPPAGVPSLGTPDPAVQDPSSLPERAETDNPRVAAAKRAKAEADPNYQFARPSAVNNFGEDLQGSARHKANVWRGLEEAERAGTAKQFVRRDSLFKVEPHNLMATIDPPAALSHLAAHLALNTFPAEPFNDAGYKSYVASVERMRAKNPSVPPAKTEAELRDQYLKAYRAVKLTAEEAARSETDPRKVLQKINEVVKRQIADIRGVDPAKRNDPFSGTLAPDAYNPVANALVSHANRTRPMTWGAKSTDVMGRMKEFAAQMQKKHGEPSVTTEYTFALLEHASDVIEGESMNSTFGTKGKAVRFDPTTAYVSVATRKGGRAMNAETVEAAKRHFMENVKLRGVQFGNYVTDDERKHHLAKSAEAMADLADVLGIPDRAISLGGRLGFAIGARGRAGAMAHYEPDTQVINLTRASGVGTLAHEWGHALDHFASDFSGMHSAGHRLSERDDAEKARRAFHQAIESSGFMKRLKTEVRDEIRQGLLPKNAEEYWTKPEEVFARSFERHVHDELGRQGRHNTYLAGLNGENKHPLWPDLEEMKTIGPAVAAYVEAMKPKLLAATQAVPG